MQPNAGHPTHRLDLGAPAPPVMRMSHASDEQRPSERGVCLRGAAERTFSAPLSCQPISSPSRGTGGHCRGWWAGSCHMLIPCTFRTYMRAGAPDRNVLGQRKHGSMSKPCEAAAVQTPLPHADALYSPISSLSHYLPLKATRDMSFWPVFAQCSTR